MPAACPSCGSENRDRMRPPCWLRIDPWHTDAYAELKRIRALQDEALGETPARKRPLPKWAHQVRG